MKLRNLVLAAASLFIAQAAASECTQNEAADALAQFVVNAGFDLGGQTQQEFRDSLVGMESNIPRIGDIYIFVRTTEPAGVEVVDMFTVRKDDCFVLGTYFDVLAPDPSAPASITVGEAVLLAQVFAIGNYPSFLTQNFQLFQTTDDGNVTEVLWIQAPSAGQIAVYENNVSITVDRVDAEVIGNGFTNFDFVEFNPPAITKAQAEAIANGLIDPLFFMIDELNLEEVADITATTSTTFYLVSLIPIPIPELSSVPLIGVNADDGTVTIFE